MAVAVIAGGVKEAPLTYRDYVAKRQDGFRLKLLNIVLQGIKVYDSGDTIDIAKNFEAIYNKNREYYRLEAQSKMHPKDRKIQAAFKQASEALLFDRRVLEKDFSSSYQQTLGSCGVSADFVG